MVNQREDIQNSKIHNKQYKNKPKINPRTKLKFRFCIRSTNKIHARQFVPESIKRKGNKETGGT